MPESKPLYFSPRQLLGYLCELERKIGTRTLRSYRAASLAVPVSQESIEAEARHMLDYVGLGGVTPSCKFDKTDAGVGGFVSDHRSSAPTITITISDKYRSDAKACLAILAHEICHRVVYNHGIDNPMVPMLDEVYTDICTIYVGFGRLIHDGYDSKVGRLGYLFLNMYDHCCLIMRMAGMDYDFMAVDDYYDDCYLEEAVKKWRSEDDKGALVRKMFFDDERELATVSRDILLLRQILNRVYTKHIDTYRRVASFYEPSGALSRGGRESLLQMFRAVYESQFDKDTSTPLAEVSDGVYRLILDLCVRYPDIDVDSLRYDILKCPCCGKELQGEKFVGKDALARCPECGMHFRSCHTPLNIVGMRRDRDRMLRREEERSKAIADREAAAKKAEDAARSELSRVNAARENFIKEGRNKGYSEGCIAQSAKCKAAFKALPSWLRWLIGRYDWPEDLK